VKESLPKQTFPNNLFIFVLWVICNVPFRNSDSLCSLLSVFPVQLKLRKKGNAVGNLQTAGEQA